MSEIITVQDLETLKKHEIFEAEVITGKVGGLATGADIPTATNAVTLQVQTTLPQTINDMNSIFDAQMLSMGYARVGTFATGATLTHPRQTLLWEISAGGDGQEYGWSGSFLPAGKVVPPNSTPASTGGIAVGAWLSRFDPDLHVALVSFSGAIDEPAAWAAIPKHSDPDMGDALDAQSKALAARTELARVDTTVSDVATGKFSVGKYVTITDRAMGLFQIVSGGTADGFGVLAAGAGKTAVYQIGGYADVAALGAKPDWSGVSGTDSYGAFNYAVTHYTQPIYVPAGANPYYISAPIPSRNLLSIFSDSEVVTLSLEGARIYAPTGFLLNGVVPETRHRISIENINVYGAGKAVAGGIAISGQFGGEIEGCHFDSFDTIMSNNMAYLLDFRRTKFTNSKTGLLISTANESNIANCFFSGVDTPIDTYSLTPGASGDKAARPITISRTNFNIDANSKPSVLSGSVVFVENYVEWFGVTPAGMAPFEFVAMRFAPPLLTVTDNEFNAHNSGTSCWRIYSDNVSGSDGAGEIAYNRFGAFTAEPIVFGGKAGFYDLVTGVNVHDNPGGLVAYPAAQFAIPFHATSRASFDGTLAIAGSSYVSVPYTADAGFVCNIPTSPGSLRIIQSGLYRVDVSALLVYTAPLRTLEYRIAANGSPITGVNTLETLPAVVAGGSNYHTIQTSAVAYLTKGAVMEFQLRNGESLSRSTISMQMLTESNVYVPK